jgi:DNA-binding transcriptional LysR family regulator
MGAKWEHEMQIVQRLKLQQLNVLLAVAETGSMAKAAKMLATSQPVVSRAIAELENVFGARLFDRSPQGVEPTLYGHALLRRAVAILNDLRASAAEIEHLADPTAGELRIGCSQPQAAGIVTAAVESLTRQRPRIAFRIELKDSRSPIVRDLRERRVDLAIASLPNSGLEDDLDAAILYHNRSCVVAGLRSPWARRQKVTLADLVDAPWVSPPVDSRPVALLLDAFRASGLPVPQITVATTACQLTMKLVAEGRFVGLSTHAYQHFNAKRLSVKVLPIELPAKPIPVAILTLKNRTISPLVQLFIDSAKEVARPLATICQPRRVRTSALKAISSER